MMLKSISVTGLFNEYDYNITLSDSSITFIHSRNGFGKSTIMRLVRNILEGDLEDAASVPFQRLDLGFDDETYLIVENNEGDLLIQMQRNELEEEMSADDLRRIMDVEYMAPERSTTLVDGCLVSSLKVYMDELTGMMKHAMENSGLVMRPVGKDEECSDADLEFWCKDLKAKLDFIKQAGFGPDMPSGYRFPPSRFEIMEYRKDYLELAFAIDRYVKEYYDLAESVIVYVDVVSGIFINKDVYVNENGIMSARMDNGTALPISKLSSGEKQILIIFYRLLFHAKPGSLVIIDEPEISLHIAWQQQMGRIMMDIAKLRGLHIIIATHSPQIIHDNWDMAVELKEDDDR